MECPPDTSGAIVRESYLKSTLNDFLQQADIILVSVPHEDRGDFNDTRLYSIVNQYSNKKIVFLDWHHQTHWSSDQVAELLSAEIDQKVVVERENICKLCKQVNQHIEQLRQINTKRAALNNANYSNLFMFSTLLYTLVLVLLVLVGIETIKFYNV